jgi:hypothetical protein
MEIGALFPLFGSFATVPEPGVGLLAIPALLLFLRHRRVFWRN